MKKIITVLLILVTILTNTICQNNFELELSEGIVLFDYFGNEPEKYNNVFAGTGSQTEINLWVNIYNTKSINSKIGFGYTYFFYLSDFGYTFIARDLASTSYINLKLGIDYNPKWSKLKFLMNFTNYILSNREKQVRAQNRWFCNLDLGIRIKLFKNLKLSFWSPISLYPIQDGKLVYRPSDLFYDPWIEITGLNLGISYGFGGKDSN